MSNSVSNSVNPALLTPVPPPGALSTTPPLTRGVSDELNPTELPLSDRIDDLNPPEGPRSMDSSLRDRALSSDVMATGRGSAGACARAAVSVGLRASRSGLGTILTSGESAGAPSRASASSGRGSAAAPTRHDRQVEESKGTDSELSVEEQERYIVLKSKLEEFLIMLGSQKDPVEDLSLEDTEQLLKMVEIASHGTIGIFGLYSQLKPTLSLQIAASVNPFYLEGSITNDPDVNFNRFGLTKKAIDSLNFHPFSRVFKLFKAYKNAESENLLRIVNSILTSPDKRETTSPVARNFSSPMPSIDTIDQLNTWLSKRANKRFLAKIQSLDLSKLEISIIPEGFFKLLPNLVSLDLSGNNIETLTKNSFQGLTKLETLNLEKNSISGISNCPFEKLENLKELNLRMNQITAYVSSSFTGLINLEKLNLSYNESFHLSFNTGLLHSLANITEIKLQGTSLRKIPTDSFKNCHKLTSLVLDVEFFYPTQTKAQLNQLTQIPSHVLYGKVRLFSPEDLVSPDGLKVGLPISSVEGLRLKVPGARDRELADLNS